MKHNSSHALLAGSFLLALSGIAQPAQATLEMPATYSARSLSLGGTGVSFMHDAAAAALNPGALQGIDTFSVALMLQPGILWQSAPLPTPSGNAQIESDNAFLPYFSASAGVRLHDRIVLGVSVLPTVGLGGSYTNVAAAGGADFKATIASMEGNLALSVKLLDNLSVGVGWRITYSSLKQKLPGTLDVPDPTAPGGVMTVPVVSETDLSGVNFAAARVGIHYAPLDILELGLMYQSKVSTAVDGTNEQKSALLGPASPIKSKLETDLNAPHQIRAGCSVNLLGRKLLLAMDGRYLFYAESNKELRIKSKTTIPVPQADGSVTSMTVSDTTTQPQNWKNTFALNFGAEYSLGTLTALRAGYALTESATPNRTAGIFGLPPGLLHSVHAGVGFHILPTFDLDLGAMYMMTSTSIGGSRPNAGDYELRGAMVALAATYKT